MWWDGGCGHGGVPEGGRVGAGSTVGRCCGVVGTGGGACRERRARCPLRVRLVTSTPLSNCWSTSAERSFSPSSISHQLLKVIDQTVEQ
jgi:hypothetical protein